MAQTPGLDCYQAPKGMVDCVLSDMVAPFGEPLFGLLVGATALFALWWAGDGDLAPPSVIAMMFAGVMIGVLPGQFQVLARSILIIGFAGGVLALAQRYFLEGTF